MLMRLGHNISTAIVIQGTTTYLNMVHKAKETWENRGMFNWALRIFRNLQYVPEERNKLMHVTAFQGFPLGGFP